jgi:hypothetical protein
VPTWLDVLVSENSLSPSAAMPTSTRPGCCAKTWWSKLAMMAYRFMPRGATYVLTGEPL